MTYRQTAAMQRGASIAQREAASLRHSVLNLLEAGFVSQVLLLGSEQTFVLDILYLISGGSCRVIGARERS